MYLCHHGRKGQEWGVTNGPPYPLDKTNKEYKRLQTKPHKVITTVKRWSAEEEKHLAEKYKSARDAKIKDKFSDTEKTFAEKTFPTLTKMRDKQLDFIEKHMPTAYKAMERQAEIYKKMLPTMYNIDKKLGFGVVVRNGKPVYNYVHYPSSGSHYGPGNGAWNHNMMFYGHP